MIMKDTYVVYSVFNTSLSLVSRKWSIVDNLQLKYLHFIKYSLKSLEAHILCGILYIVHVIYDIYYNI